jgi:2-desacetyl-2-hydroxyethyl bacteriochlorophyllide A dehydrogenase
MQAALFDGSPVLKFVEYPLRALQNNEVLLKISACGVCGTDLKILAGESHSRPPIILGHEFCGYIKDCGNAVKNLKPGDYVSVDPNIYCGECQFCRRGRINLCENLTALGVDINGGFAEYCLAPAAQCHQIDPKISPLIAALIEPLSCVLYGFRLAAVEQGDNVLIIGAGMIGLMMLQLMLLSGAAQIWISEVDDTRRTGALKAGANHVLNLSQNDAADKLKELTQGGADIVIECVGQPQAVEQALQLVKSGGRVVIFGVSPRNQMMTLAPYEIYRRDLTIRGSFLNPFTFQPAVELISSGQIQLDCIDMGRFALRDIAGAFENQRFHRNLKTVIDFS